ncbi:MAG: hypothetical protein HY260_16660 [Chloroflexi bacterium]|nr:hypothetical protein [Chloroflexota bacterium]
MTTITLEVPDELATRLAPMRDRIPDLLSIALDLFPAEMPLTLPAANKIHPAFDEMIDFLASGPTPKQIVAFKVSPAAQVRLEELLDKNREGGLAEEETAELDVYEQINFVLLLLKARARPLLSSPN